MGPDGNEHAMPYTSTGASLAFEAAQRPFGAQRKRLESKADCGCEHALVRAKAH